MRHINVIELFSGIGSQAKALENIGVDFSIVNTCEWNMHSIVAYAFIHGMMNSEIQFEGTKEELVETLLSMGVSSDGKSLVTSNALQSMNEIALNMIYAAIVSTRNLVDISRLDGTSLDSNIDLMTYSFPCQDLSNVGAFHGYKAGIDRDADNRSGLLWQVERMLLERKAADLDLPKFLLMENVPALNSSRHRKNFEEWQRQLNDLGYYNKQYLLNAKDFGVPQNRERLFMISVLTYGDADANRAVETFFNEHDLGDVEYRATLEIDEKKLVDILRTDYSILQYYQEALESQPNPTPSRLKIWEENAKLTDEYGNVLDTYTSTITTKQDRNPNSGNLKVQFDNGKAEFRYLTPRECLMLMGFDERDYDILMSNNFEVKKKANIFARDNIIKMAGNSIAVNVLEHIFSQIMELDSLLFM